ncbi:C2 calcium-dependent domain-containing protein 6 isoform X3 [Sceloporus undulatus]|uniref:C2 calcium-dependent domain-containing protein 6 isoform X3 n=1 Tax=Sceloporus undulatus TaxID=8520 RepID=UPI001C4C16F9|nr:C2 calcium-dependent domain-containing protein 6 isoform X3 [Sceloporus undulatus]
MPRHGQRKGSLGPPPPEGPSSPAAAYPRGREPSVTSVTSAGGGAALTDEFSVATVIGLKHMMLLRSQKTSEDSFASNDIHNLIPCGDVVGLMAVIVKQCKDFTPKFTVNRDTYLLVRISIDKIMKCTNPQVFKANKNSRKPITINFGDVRYFSVKVPKQKSDPRNRITLELVGFEGPKDFPRLFGNVTMHLYDVIQKQSFTEICAMRIRNMVFCTVEVEFMFCYGCLGYGYSHQLKLPGTDPAQAVAYSMFLRVPPPEERKDHSSNVIKPQHMDYPAFLSPDLNVTIANVELDPPAEISEHYQSLQKALKEPPRERLERMKKEYRSLPTWPEKAEYLDQLILKKGPKTGTPQPKMSRFREIVGKIHMPGHKVAPSIVVGVVEEEKIPDIPPDEVQPDELQPDEMQSDEMQPDGMQADEIQPDRIQPDENQSDEIQTDELQPDEMQPDGMQADEIQPDRIQPPEIQPDEIQTDELQPNEMQPPEILEWASVPHDVSNLYFQPRELEPSGEELESEGELVGVTNFLNGSTETTQLIPTLAVTSSTTYPSRSSSGDVVEDKVRRRKFSHESETSLSSSSEVPAEFSETGDSESFIFAGPMGQEELPATVKKPATIEYMPEPIQSKESLPRSDFPLPVLDECVTPKSSESVVKSEQKWLLKDNGFQKAVFSGSKFEPFLRRVCKVQPPPLSIGKTDIFSQLEETPDDMKEVEDQDPPHGVPFTKKDSNLDTNRSGEQLSILRLIERKMGLEEEGQNIATQTEEPTSLGITSSIPKKSLRNKLSEAEIKQAQMSLKDSLEEFLVDKLVKVSVLESVLSKNLENLVAERLSQEREDSDSEKQSPEERKASSREKFSEPDIETLKEVSQNLQTRLVGKLSQQGIIPDMKVAEKDQKVYFPSATDLLKRGESLSKERITQNEIVTIKPLSDSHSGDISEIEQDVKETGLSASRHEDDREPTWPFKIQDSLIKRALSKADLKKEPSTQSLEIIRITVPLSTETDSNNQQLSNYDILLEKVLKAEITSLKSFLSKNLQDHLKDKLAEIGVTPKDLKTVCSKLSFTRKGKHMMTPEDQVPSDEDLVEETPVLSESVQNILQALSKREVTNLKSALNKKIQDHISERLAEIGLITEEELREILENLLPVVAKETSPTGIKESELLKEEQTTPPLTQNLHERFSEEELQNLKSLLSKLLKEGHRDALSESEVKGLTSVLQKSCEDLPIQSSSKSEIKEGVEIKDKSCKISSTNAEDELKGSNVIVLERRKDHSKESLHKISALDEKYGIRRETVDLSVNGIFEVEKRNQETQTVLPRKRVKHISKKESHRWPSSPNNPEMSDLKKGLCEAELKSKSSDEILKTVSEPFTSSSFLSAHDIGVQTVLRNYLTKPNYPAKPSFPVNPQTFILLHSESEDEAKTSCKYHQKPHSKRKYERKRDLVSHHSHQAATNAQTKKEKSSSGSSSKEVLKEKGKRHGEPSPSRPTMTEYRKDLKTTASPSNMRKESQKLKEERKRENEVKSKKATHKTAALSDPHLSKNLPASGRTKGNTLVPAGTDDINMEAFKHLEKAIERALLDLGRIPDSSSLQGRPNTAPTAAALMSSDSSRSFTSLIGAPRNQAGSITEMLYNQEQILKMTPEQLEIVLRILQNILRQNTRPQNNE